MNNKNSPKTVQELDTEVQKQIREDMSSTINSIYDELIVDKKISILPEDIFVQEFLPLFYGTVEDKEVRIQKIQSWIAIAGSPSSEVSVIDDENNILFNVPPAINSSSINVTNRGDKDLNKIFEAFSKDNFPIRGSRNLLANLDNKQNDILANANLAKKEAYERMNAIFTRYGLETKSDKDSKDNDDEDFQYE